ncbi:tyrosine-type recombinase/integrase [Dictyobacter kobayashii]|uniref:Tyrosine recombinase XerC n=1 Tax=Dictyobacter kobayashii TaxID=2014872 RepID=A0A402AHT9_9CHLR|nr:tyrosine-type recombinase/integrase [Dictyobacter kobayashii]GCE18623.1 tyrosine recombinase XerC [Dictyobacter kobayashii]
MEESRVTLRQALDDFLEVCRINKASVHTLRNYGKDLDFFLSWLESAYQLTHVNELQLKHLRGWIGYLQKYTTRRGENLDDNTVRQYGVHVQVFCHWLEHEDYIEKPITTKFKLPSVEQKFVPTFTPEEIQKLLDACDEGAVYRPKVHKALTARNRAIVSVLVDTGIRRKELAGLRLRDIDRDMRVLLIHRKGDKWQQVPISREGFKPLHEYLTKYRPQLAAVGGRTKAHKDDPVFLTDMGEQLSIVGVSKLFNRLKKRTGIEDKKVSPHNCRRYMATTQLAMGRSPLDVQRQMGHTTLQMTNKYASLSIEHLQRSHEEFSPLRAKHVKDDRGPTGSGYWDE